MSLHVVLHFTKVLSKEFAFQSKVSSLLILIPEKETSPISSSERESIFPEAEGETMGLVSEKTLVCFSV